MGILQAPSRRHPFTKAVAGTPRMAYGGTFQRTNCTVPVKVSVPCPVSTSATQA